MNFRGAVTGFSEGRAQLRNKLLFRGETAFLDFRTSPDPISSSSALYGPVEGKLPRTPFGASIVRVADNPASIHTLVRTPRGKFRAHRR